MIDYVTCSKCGKQCSNKTGQELIVRAWVECPECIEKEKSFEIRLSAKTNDHGETHFYLDNYDEIWTSREFGDLAYHLWHELGLPSEDGEHWIEIKVVNK